MSNSKIKQIPEDFSVEELTETLPSGHGDFCLYLLKKKGSTTPDAIQRIQKSWKLDSRQISFGGLKDKHAVTSQFFSIKGSFPVTIPIRLDKLPLIASKTLTLPEVAVFKFCQCSSS